MKKTIVFLSMMFCIMTSAFAQKGIQAIGVHLNYGTEIETVGLGMKYQYNLTDNVRFEPSLNYYFENDGIDMFDVNFNVHYLLPLTGDVRIYPLAGLTYTKWNWDLGKAAGWNIDGSLKKFGVNLGAGAEFDIADNWMMNFEVKYQCVSKVDQAVVSLGVAYMF